MSTGRPREFEKTEALQKALMVFWKQGYRGASLDDLTSAMGISRPSLYAAFGDKSTLFLATVELYLTEYISEARNALSEEADIKTAVERFLRISVRQFTNPKLPSGCLVACHLSDVQLDQAVRHRLVMAAHADETLLTARLTQALSDGQLPASESPAELAAFFTCLLSGLSQSARTGSSRTKLDRIVSRAISVLAVK
ncbi:MAG: TetR/AcrR family transcriptional regulator [Planctomycetota bacterium]|nr:MAG: TetR/AcrR family transcriptional regulator [Planctomycetota bacterium]